MKIKGHGVFQDYTRPPEMKKFGIKNLIYGWNYSGKTTISRLFAQLESKTENPDLKHCEFKFSLDDQIITEETYQQSNLSVRVFNSDFINDNLHFDGGGFNPILLLGKDSEDAQKRIDFLNIRVKKSTISQRKLNSKSEDFQKKIADEKTDSAKSIRDLLKIYPYTATQLGTDITALEGMDSQLLSDISLTENLELALTPENKKPNQVDTLSACPSIITLHAEVAKVLSSTPSFSNTIKHLKEHPDIEKWVESGIHLHPKSGVCEFCGNSITIERLELFRSHFSKDLTEHKLGIEDLFQKVEGAKFTIALPNKNEFNPQFREPYLAACEPLKAAIEVFNSAVNILSEEIKKKIAEPHKGINPTPISESLEKAIVNILGDINAVITSNNQIAINFPQMKEVATKKVKYHYVQKCIDKLVNSAWEYKKVRQTARINRLKSYSLNTQNQISALQALISQAQLGREKINIRLSSMLGAEAIQIEVFTEPVSGQERFRLVRKNGNPARNLSEGERTAISFSYFLTKLQELKPSEFKETIVYIDDPISSLDANHLFQVNAAIKEVFFSKDQTNEWVTNCKQFFLSTHNFQFFDLVRDIGPTKENKACLYFLRKVSAEKSILSNMPKSLSKYDSEYHFLFETIYKFRQSNDKPAYEGLMLLPNVVRRFVELYTYARMPSTKNLTVDNRAEIIFPKESCKRILKILHYFSHANNMDRLMGNSELIFDLEHAIEDLLNQIEEMDPVHWRALMDAVQMES